MAKHTGPPPDPNAKRHRQQKPPRTSPNQPHAGLTANLVSGANALATALSLEDPTLAPRIPDLATRRGTHAYDRAQKDILADKPIRYPRELQEALDALNHKQRRFAQLYASGMTAREAYLRVYCPDYDLESSDPVPVSLVYAHELRNLPSVNMAIKLLQEWLDSQWLQDSRLAIDFCLSFWHDIVSDERQSPKDRIKASELIARVGGAFVQRVEVTHHQGVRAEDALALLTEAMGQMQLGPTPIEAAYQVVDDDLLALSEDGQPNTGHAMCPRCGGAYMYPGTIGGDGEGI